MKFTVAICTWNGAARISDPLDSLVALDDGVLIDWELLIVDNNSSDQTQAICKRYEDRLPLRIVNETQQGHSFSRNCAIENARGEFIAWIDDDVAVAPGWLAAYDSAITSGSEFSFWGGKITPRFDYPVPNWLTKNWEICAGVYAERDLSEKYFEVTKIEHLPYGANFVTRKRIHEQIRFDEKFGRVGSGVRGFDEIDVLSRALETGHRGCWIPQAQVQHIIPQSRTKLQYLIDYFAGQGETWIERGVSNKSLSVLNQELRFHQLRYFAKRWLPWQNWFVHLVQASNLNGQIKAIERKQAKSST